MFGWFSPIPAGLAADLIAARAVPGRQEKLQQMAEGLAKDGRQGMLPRDKLAAFAMPVTVIWGGLDNILPVRHADGLPSGWSVRLLPELGHMLPEEAPDMMADMIRHSAGLV